MDVGVVCLDEDVTSIGIEGQQFEVHAGRDRNGNRVQVAVVPVALAAKLASFPHRYKLVPIPEDAQRTLRNPQPLVLNREGFLGTDHQPGHDDGREKTLAEIQGSGPSPGQVNEPGNLNPTRTTSGSGPDTITSKLTGADTGAQKNTAEEDAAAKAEQDKADQAALEKAAAETTDKSKGKNKDK